MKNPKAFIKKELKDLGIPEDSDAYRLLFENAVEASDILTKQGLRKYIEEYAALLPQSMFE